LLLLQDSSVAVENEDNFNEEAQAEMHFLCNHHQFTSYHFSLVTPTVSKHAAGFLTYHIK
jgi:hypothetical protein